MPLAGELNKRKLLNLPNLITYIRVAAIPFILVLLLPPASGWRMNVAFAIFLVASLTDTIDGAIARRQGEVTAFGRLLDPLADKLLTTAVLVMLIPLGKVAAWLVVLIIGREMAITGLRSIAASHGMVISASRLGKNKMIFLTVALHFLIIHVPPIQGLAEGIGTVLLWISLFLGYWSAFHYCREFYGHVTGR